MRVRMLTAICGPRLDCQAGAEADLPRRDAVRLIKSGQAEPVPTASVIGLVAARLGLGRRNPSAPPKGLAWALAGLTPQLPRVLLPRKPLRTGGQR